MNPLPKGPEGGNTPETKKPVDKYLQFAKEKLTPNEYKMFILLRKKFQMDQALSAKDEYNYKKLRLKVETHKALKEFKDKMAQELKKAREEVLRKPKAYVRSAEKWLTFKILNPITIYESNLMYPTEKLFTGKTITEHLKKYLAGLDKDKLPTKEQVKNTKRILTKVEKEIIDLTSEL